MRRTPASTSVRREVMSPISLRVRRETERKRRPMLLIVCECEWQGKTTTIKHFLQNDWHVRVMGADGKVRHSSLAQPGDELLAHIEAPGRHTGVKVTEHIVER